jgi:phage terminase large subunit
MMAKTLKIKTPRWFKPLLKPSRYKAAYGGRGSGKSHAFAEAVIESHVIDQKRRTVCVREIQKSLSQSVKRLLELKIEQLGVEDYFEIQQFEIRSRHGDGIIIFQGMQNHTSDSIKSLKVMTAPGSKKHKAYRNALLIYCVRQFVSRTLSFGSHGTPTKTMIR